MAIGLGVILLLLGAVIAFVLELNIPGVGDMGLGLILMVAGLITIALSFMKARALTARHTTVARDVDPNGGFVEERRSV